MMCYVALAPLVYTPPPLPQEREVTDRQPHRTQDLCIGFWASRQHLADAIVIGHTCPYYTHFPVQVWAPRHTCPQTNLSGLGREVVQGEAESWMLLGAPARVSATCLRVWPWEPWNSERRSVLGLQKTEGGRFLPQRHTDPRQNREQERQRGHKAHLLRAARRLSLLSASTWGNRVLLCPL